MGFYATGINKLISFGKSVLIVMVTILINKDVLEPRCSDLKFMVHNHSYVCTHLIQSYGNQNSVVIAQKQTYKSMGQNRVPRNKQRAHMPQSIYLQQRRQEYTMEKRKCLQQVVLGKLHCCMKINEVSSYTGIDSKWPKDLNIRHDTIKLLEENTGKKLSDIDCTNVFLGLSPKAIEIKTKISKWNLIKLTSFCTAKENIKTIFSMKRKPIEWKKLFANDVTDKGLISKIYK